MAHRRDAKKSTYSNSLASGIDQLNEKELNTFMDVLKRDIHFLQSVRPAPKTESRRIPSLITRWTSRLIALFGPDQPRYADDGTSRDQTAIIRFVSRQVPHFECESPVQKSQMRSKQTIPFAVFVSDSPSFSPTCIRPRRLDDSVKGSPSDLFYFQSCRKLMDLRRRVATLSKESDQKSETVLLRQPTIPHEVHQLIDEMVDFLSETFDGVSSISSDIVSAPAAARTLRKPKRPTTLAIDRTSMPLKELKSAPSYRSYFGSAEPPFPVTAHSAALNAIPKRTRVYSIESERGIVNSPVKTPNRFKKRFGEDLYDFNDIRRWLPRNKKL